MEVNRLNPVQKATYFSKITKVGKMNIMYNNCYDTYRPVIIGFVQYQHSSVQLVLKNGSECSVKSHLGDNEYPPAV